MDRASLNIQRLRGIRTVCVVMLGIYSALVLVLTGVTVLALWYLLDIIRRVHRVQAKYDTTKNVIQNKYVGILDDDASDDINDAWRKISSISKFSAILKTDFGPKYEDSVFDDERKRVETSIVDVSTAANDFIKKNGSCYKDVSSVDDMSASKDNNPIDDDNTSSGNCSRLLAGQETKTGI